MREDNSGTEPLAKEIERFCDRRCYLDWNLISIMQDPSGIKDGQTRKWIDVLKALFESSESFLIPYSDAHLRDIDNGNVPGNEDRIQARLEYLETISRGICIIQYADSEQTIFERKSPAQFFNELSVPYEEGEHLTWDDLIESINNLGLPPGFPDFKQIPHNIDFNLHDSSTPLLRMMFDRARSDNSMNALMSDIYNLTQKIRRDPLFYREFRNHLRESLQLAPGISAAIDGVAELDKVLAGPGIGNSFDEILEMNEDQRASNKTYSRFISTFMQLDLMGYNPDKMSARNTYMNIFYDAMHAYYAGCCKFYLSFDKKSVRKANAVYQHLNIGSRGMWVPDFCSILEEELGI